MPEIQIQPETGPTAVLPNGDTVSDGGLLTTCRRCEQAFSQEELEDGHIDPDDTFYCETCWTAEDEIQFRGVAESARWWERNGCFTCDNCGEDFMAQDGPWDDMCRQCYENENEEESEPASLPNNGRAVGRINNYNFKPDEMPFINSKNDATLGRTDQEVYYGVELEIELEGLREHAAGELLQKINKIAYIKSDGSLANGIEVVTYPATLEAHRSLMGKFLETEFKPIKKRYGIKAWHTETCGMHIHVSRAPLSALQIGKMIAFIHNGANYGFVFKIAGRDQTQFGGYSSKKEVREIALLRKRAITTSRYTAVNVTGKDTVEFRLFRGNISSSGLMRNLEFVDALVRFTAPCQRTILESTSAAEFIKWLGEKKQRARYPILTEYLRANNTLARAKARKRKYVQPVSVLIEDV